jgi:hypothetical protein
VQAGDGPGFMLINKKVAGIRKIGPGFPRSYTERELVIQEASEQNSEVVNWEYPKYSSYIKVFQHSRP